jgi:hypothetical protein
VPRGRVPRRARPTNESRVAPPSPRHHLRQVGGGCSVPRQQVPEGPQREVGMRPVLSPPGGHHGFWQVGPVPCPSLPASPARAGIGRVPPPPRCGLQRRAAGRRVRPGQDDGRGDRTPSSSFSSPPGRVTRGGRRCCCCCCCCSCCQSRSKLRPPKSPSRIARAFALRRFSLRGRKRRRRQARARGGTSKHSSSRSCLRKEMYFLFSMYMFNHYIGF